MKKTPEKRIDPHAKREAARYQEPLPSRELILEVLAENGVPVPWPKLAQMLGLETSRLDAFERRLRAMERDGQILRNRKDAVCVLEKLDLIKGRVEGHPDGFGFLIPDDGGSDLFLDPKQMQKVLHGDRIMAREAGLDRRGRREGAIVEVLERKNRNVVGKVLHRHGIVHVVPENKRLSQDILIRAGQDAGAKAGQVVMVEILAQPDGNVQPVGRVTEVLGNYADPGMEIEIALRKHELPFEFSAHARAACDKLPQKVLAQELKGRTDLRSLALVTIDGESAKDFDDAVYCESRGEDFRLVVAIADVSHYVKPGDVLDHEALARGNSVYFPRRVIPMLPEPISNGLCSLNPNVDRLCMACDMIVSQRGEIKNYRFYPAVMHSKARLTYTEVAAALLDQKSAAAKKLQPLLPQLHNLDHLYRALAKARAKRGAIDFETIENQIVFNDQGKIERIVPVARNDAHRVIEECMLAANVCASDFLASRRQVMLYRVHQGPTPEKLEVLREFLRGFGLGLGGGDHPHARDYAKLLAGVRGRPDAQLIQTVMLRSLQQAVYSPENVGHFGLAYESYTHFTSPIRRYPDLLVHRAIRAVLAGKTYNAGDWRALGVHCSQTERRADDATRDVEAWLKCYYMQDRIGEPFDGTISAVTGFGIFVALDGIYVEGLVHVSELGSDYFHFDAAKHELLGERSHRRFRLGDRVRVKLVRADLETSKIDFVLEGEARKSAPNRREAKR